MHRATLSPLLSTRQLLTRSRRWDLTADLLDEMLEGDAEEMIDYHETLTRLRGEGLRADNQLRGQVTGLSVKLPKVSSLSKTASFDQMRADAEQARKALKHEKDKAVYVLGCSCLGRTSLSTVSIPHYPSATINPGNG